MFSVELNGSFYRDDSEMYGDSGYISPGECGITIERYDDKILIHINPYDRCYAKGKDKEPHPARKPCVLELDKEDARMVGSILMKWGREPYVGD